ncbi:MAG TPA: hypothetical protein VL854_12450 [Nitrososphaeraceae archaeon]|nr:hypothetical protein [Nitrososphaeraceae archaeon]
MIPAGVYHVTRNRGFRILGLSIFSIAFIFVAYSNLTSSEIPQINPQKLYGLAQLVIILTVTCLIFCVYGVYLVVKFSIDTSPNNHNLLSFAAHIFKKKSYFKLLIISSVLYGLFFAYLSRIVIYLPTEVSLDHAINIPSFVLTLCCGSPGYFPMATIRLTENLSILLIPLNLILAVAVSLLVGFNIVLNVYATQLARSQTRRKISAVSTMGAFSGLFIGCPTCAGSLFSALLGFGAGTAVSILAPFQTLFVLMSLPVLVLTSILLLRNIRNSESCESKDRHAH